MNHITYLFPVLALAIAFLCGVNNYYWWAYLLITAAVEGLIAIIHWYCSTVKEYLSGYVVCVIHHFAWVERVERTETRTNSKGQTYTVKKVEYVEHPDEWYCELNTGRSHTISESTFNYFCRSWRTGRYHINVYHNNCVRGGGGEACDWDKDPYNTRTETYTQRYKNPIIHSYSLFRRASIGKTEAKVLGLYDYPPVYIDQDVVLSRPKLIDKSHLARANADLQHLNAFAGRSSQIHAFILIFPAKSGLGIAEKQRDYWKGFNKNEFVVCLGIRKGKVEWSRAQSWMDDITLHCKTEEYFRKHSQLDLVAYIKWLNNNLVLWQRKPFKDFEYLGNHLGLVRTLTYWGISLLLTTVATVCFFWMGG